MNKPSQPDRHLAEFLATFGAAELGEGDTDAGANLLGAMAVTLGNLARPGSGIRPPGGRLLPAGASLLATGSTVGSLVTDEVITPVGRFQDNLLAQLDRLLKDDAAERAKGTPREWVLSKGPKPNTGEKALFQLMTRDPDMPPLMGSYEEEWMDVLGEPPAHRLGDLVRRPRCFIVAHTRSHLEKLLPGAHLGEALVAIGLGRAADAAKFGGLCPPLMDGMFPGGPAGERVRGRLIVTDHGRVLREVATAPNDRNSWLARLVWLVEGGAGPDAPTPPEKGDDLVKLPNLTGRFEEAVRTMIANRLSSQEPRPIVYTDDISVAQGLWMEFLRGMEKDLPGIPGTARSLFPSLTFGMLRLADTAGLPEGFQFQLRGVLAFAKHLIRRMAALRHEMLWSPEQERRLEIKKKLVERLADGPQGVRGLARRFHRLPMAHCEELLIELEQDGEVVPFGDKWKLATFPFSATQAPALRG